MDQEQNLHELNGIGFRLGSNPSPDSIPCVSLSKTLKSIKIKYKKDSVQKYHKKPFKKSFSFRHNLDAGDCRSDC